MKNKILKIMILVLMIIMSMHTSIFASVLRLSITTETKEIKTGEEFIIKVSWNEGMQAADFYLNYDNEKVEFIKANISEDYINSKNEGQLRTAWFSMDDTDKTNIEYTFKAKKSGTVDFETKAEIGGFATGELRVPRKYIDGKLSIEILPGSSINIFKILGIIIGIIIVFILIKIIVRIRIEKSKKKFR